MAPTVKRARKEHPTHEALERSPGNFSVLEESDHLPESSTDEGSVASGSSSTDTEEEINRAQSAKSKKTLKRKRRATSPTPFGQTLEALLATSVPGGTIGIPLALKPSVARRKNDEKLELKAKRALEGERKEREEKRHIQDVIEGWSNEDERGLRKVAQRGVVHLFNAIQQAQSTSAASAEAKKGGGAGKATLKASEVGNKPAKSKKAVSGGGTSLDKNSFLEAIRGGGVVRQS